MARSSFRAHGPTEPRTLPSATLLAVLVLVPALGACVAYEAAPVDPSRILAELEARRPEPFLGGEPEIDGAAPGQLASFAITHNPSLQAARARIGVAQALLVEAGLLSDPEIGWDGMDALAALIVDGNATRIDYLAGFGLSIPLPRPGELDAREGAARWRVEETRLQLTEVEWVLARDVRIACEDVLEAERLLAQSAELIALAESTRDYFERAQGAGAATAIQANLAAGDFLAIRAQRVRLASRLREARHRLNALLGLPPSAAVPVVAAPEELAGDEIELGAEALVERSLALRPDLAALLAAYRAAEDDLRLEVTRQFPQVSIGTGIWLVPGVFTRFNRPAIDVALARREVLRREVEARVHEVRRDIQDAWASLDESRRELSFLELELLPNAETSLRLVGEAFGAGEVTLLEILTLQRALVDARTRTTEARAELMRKRWRLLAASGTLLTAKNAGPVEQDTRGEPVR